MSAKKVLLVDDSEVDLAFMQEMLKSHFETEQALSGADAVKLCRDEETRPSVIVLDYMMPDMDGLDTCKAIIDIDHDTPPEIIFVSANDTMEDKLKSYEAGASDYLTKPVDPALLQKKISSALARHLRLLETHADKKQAMQTAMMAISDVGEQANVTRFLRSSFSCNDLPALAELILTTTEEYFLAASVRLSSSSETINKTNTGEITPMEMQLLASLEGENRIFQRSTRLLIHYGNVSLLIKDMPMHNEEMCGRLRDNLAIIIEGAANRAESILATERNNHYLAETNKNVAELYQIKKFQKSLNEDLAQDLIDELKEDMLSYGLTSEQEKALVHNIENIAKKLQEAGNALDMGLDEVLNQLRGLNE